MAGVTPHLFRRTVATAVNDNASVELAAELLGHTDSKITVLHYIRRNEVVNPATATAPAVERLLVKTVIRFHTKGHPKLLLGRAQTLQQPHQAPIILREPGAFHLWPDRTEA